MTIYDVSTERPQLDLLPTADVVELLLRAEERVVPAVRNAAASVAAAAELVCSRLELGGRVVLVGAGTSGRIAVAEAAELPGTFGLDRALVEARVAGGAGSTDHDEDDLALVHADLDGLALTDRDVLIAVAASGSTPYTLAMAEAACAAGAVVIAVVNRIGSPLAARATVAVEAVVGPEVLRDSTRLTAGTAQKVVLNAITTAAMVRFGRVHGDLMVDVEPANAKLRERAISIVTEIAGSDRATAERALDACAGNARAAVIAIVLGVDASDALLRATHTPTLRAALAARDVSDA